MRSDIRPSVVMLCASMLRFTILRVITIRDIVLSVVMLCVSFLRVVMLRIVILSVVILSAKVSIGLTLGGRWDNQCKQDSWCHQFRSENISLSAILGPYNINLG